MGAKSIADSIGSTIEEAQEIIDGFYKSFPRVKKWMDESLVKARENEYVEDFWGRRRRLPEINLPPYHVEYKDKKNENTEFNPLLETTGIVGSGKSNLLDKYFNMAIQTKNKKELDTVIKQASSDGIILHSNSGKITQAERQSINSQIQGSAASMSKKAMVKVFNDPELRRLGFHTVLQIHDELIGECPAENAEEIATRLTTVMKGVVADEIPVPFKCDPTIEPCWYYSDYTDIMQEEFKKAKTKNPDTQKLFEEFCETYSECTPEQIHTMLSDLL